MCPSGTTSSVAGAGLCSCGPCEAGHYCAGGAQQPSACQCRPGFYSPATDLSTASQCSLDAPACSNYPCTAGHSCAGAAAQPVSCDCAVGTFSGGGQGACDCGPCPLGAHCAGGSMQPASLGAGCAIADEQGTTCLTCFDEGAVPSTTAGGLAACECTVGYARGDSIVPVDPENNIFTCSLVPCPANSTHIQSQNLSLSGDNSSGSSDLPTLCRCVSGFFESSPLAFDDQTATWSGSCEKVLSFL